MFAWIIDQWFTQEELAHIVSWTTEDRTQYSLALTEKLSKLLKDREVIKELSEVQKKLCKRTYERAIIQAKTNPNELPIDDPLAFDESSDNLDD